MLRKIKNFFTSRTVYKETEMRIISLFVEKTYPVFAGTFGKKIGGGALFVVGKTKYGLIKIPIGEKVYYSLGKKLSANRSKIPVSINVKLKIRETDKENQKETKILAGMVILHDIHEKKPKT